MKFVPSVSSIADKYDAILLDLWGTVHDGSHLYPGVKECLSTLRKQGKKIILLSNAPRRAAKAAETLARLGIQPELYDHIVTSGEVACDFFGLHKNVPYIYMGPEKDANLCDGLSYIAVQNPAEAVFILNAGFETDEQTLEDVLPRLAQWHAAKLPMVCINPDTVVVKQTGEQLLCAGLIAQRYQEMGGETVYYGKPYPDIYGKSLSLLEGMDKKKILAVGDLLETDILGAQRMEMDTALIMGGVLKTLLGLNDFGDEDQRLIEVLCKNGGVTPTYAIPAFNY